MDILLSQIDPGEGINARTTGRDDGIDTLANSIEQLGLLQPLLVRQEGDRYRVIDGNRRLAALLRNVAAAGGDAPDFSVPVLLYNVDDSDAHTRSLAANIERLPMHEVDQYEAFARLEADGKTVADIARLFGISERRVQQRLALGNIPKPIRDEYRAGNLRAETLKAVANADPKLVKKAWKDGLRGWQLSEALTPPNKSILNATSHIAQFIGRERYAAEGGTFVRDLFVPEEEERWADVELAMLIAAKVADEKCEQLVADGWQFAHRVERSWVDQAEYPDGKIDKKKFTSAEDFKDWKELDKQLADLSPDDDSYAGLFDQRAEIESEYNARGWSDEQKSRLGCVITSEFEVVYGVAPPVLRDQHGNEVDGDTEIAEPKPPAEVVEEGPGPIAHSLRLVLEQHLTHATMNALQVDPRFAIILLVDHLWQQKTVLGYVPREISMHYDDYRGQDGLVRAEGLKDLAKLVSKTGMAKAVDFASRIKCWQKLEDAVVDKILAYFIAQSLTNQQPAKPIPQLMQRAGYLDIGKTWLPETEDFFMKLTKPQLLDLANTHEIDVLVTMKKSELAQAVRDALPVDWLPIEIQP